MGCCGSNRSTSSGLSRTSHHDAGPGSIRLRWRRRITASVTGPVTGVAYHVSPDRPIAAVDGRDATGLLATGFFEQVG